MHRPNWGGGAYGFLFCPRLRHCRPGALVSLAGPPSLLPPSAQRGTMTPNDTAKWRQPHMSTDTPRPAKFWSGARRVHNLKNVNVDIPLNRIVGIAGGVGLGQVQPGAWGAVRRGVAAVPGRPVHLHPAADDPGRPGRRGRGALRPGGAGLHQRPGAGGIRSTFGTGTELLTACG